MRAAAGCIQLDVPAGAAPGHSVVGEGQAAGAVRIGISQRQPAVKGQREVARRSGSQVKADVHGLLCAVAADGQADVVPAALPDVVVTGEKVLSPTACGQSPLAEGSRKNKNRILADAVYLLLTYSPFAASRCRFAMSTSSIWLMSWSPRRASTR